MPPEAIPTSKKCILEYIWSNKKKCLLVAPPAAAMCYFVFCSKIVLKLFVCVVSSCAPFCCALTFYLCVTF